MNDIEREIEGVKEEEVNMKYKLNRNRDEGKRKNIIMYVIIGVLALALIILLGYILLNGKKLENDNDDSNGNEVVNDEVDEPEISNLGYVSCDDNTALLNVRNSTGGNIIDGLSCYKEVTIEEELDGTDVCNKWYRVSYDKNGNSYTGYVCGTYIKKYQVDDSVINNVKKIIDKANDYYDNSVLKAYCGDTNGSKIIDFGNNLTGEYVKSEYKDLNEMKAYLLSFLDEEMVRNRNELQLSDVLNPKYNDNYYEIDGDLYCRNYADKGWMTYYTGNYDIEVTSYSDNKILVNIAYQYIDDESDCKLDKLSKCSRNDFVYGIGKITIENGIITKMDFHK